MYRLRSNLWVKITGDMFGNRTLLFGDSLLTDQQLGWIKDNFPTDWDHHVEKVD